MSAATATDQNRKRFKWEPVALFVAITIAGVALVVGGERWDVRIGPFRGKLEQQSEGALTYRIRYRNGDTTAWMGPSEFSAVLGEKNFTELLKQRNNAVFRTLNITSWWGVTWVVVGLVGQFIFMGRMAVQWIISERKRESVVPPIFWYLSLIGGLMLFTYFVWRQDIVGVLGQSSGVAIYMRNIRLISKRRRREQDGQSTS